MTIFAIGDLHLPAEEKPMDVFGDHWIDHFRRISEDWRAKVSEDDVVLIPGDIMLLVLQGDGAIAFGTVLSAFAVFFALTALSFFLFTLARDYMAGVLLHFFGTLTLCFISGCMYPVYFFPVALQKISAYLPTGLARAQLSGCITGVTDLFATLLLILYGIVFLLLTVLLTRKRLKGGHQ